MAPTPNEPTPTHQTPQDELANKALAAAEDEAERDLDAELHAAAAMQIDPEDLQPKPWVLPDRRRILWALGIVALIVALVLGPPLINANRFRHRITQSVSESLGRPVRIDSVTLNLLPVPGFTLDNFVVGDDPAFSSEPVIRANSVRVTLRVWSLWRRRVEFSRISLEDPSVNLVHRADGRWNIESLLLQASKIDAAPTAQQGAGDAPRFPYVEATGARVNVKMGLEKMPIALTEADLALWLTQPNQWKFRLEGRPTRTNTAAADTGILRVQGTLGKAATLQDAPVDMSLDWRAAPLGGLSWVLLARDAGFRGSMTLRTTIQGTIGRNKIDTEFDLNDLRRSDFVPQHTLDAAIRCTGTASATFHQLTDIRCGWPPAALANPAAEGLKIAGALPDAAHWESANAHATLTGAPAAGLLDVMRLSSTRISPDLNAGGIITGTLDCCVKPANGESGWAAFSGEFAIEKASLSFKKEQALIDSDVTSDVGNGQLTVHPVALEVGAPQPAMLDGHIDATGISLHLAGPALRSRLLQLAAVLPPFGDGLEGALPAASTGTVEAPIRIDLTLSRSWTTGPTWSATVVRPVKRRRGSSR